MVPPRLRHRIAEPLMRDLVGDGPLDVSTRRDATLAVEDRRGVLHPTESGCGLHVRQLLEGVGPDRFREIFHHFRLSTTLLPSYQFLILI